MPGQQGLARKGHSEVGREKGISKLQLSKEIHPQPTKNPLRTIDIRDTNTYY